MNMSRLMNKNHAEYLLGLTNAGTYSKSAVKKAYRKMAKKCHPDVARARSGDIADAAQKMVELNEAYRYLISMFGELGEKTLTADGVHYADIQPEPVEIYDFWTQESPPPPPEPEPDLVPGQPGMDGFRVTSSDPNSPNFSQAAADYKALKAREEVYYQRKAAKTYAASAKKPFWKRFF